MIQLPRRSLLTSFGVGLFAGHGAALAQPTFGDTPFQLGVAAGDPLPDGFVIWTRLAPRPLEPGHGMDAAPMAVTWEVASDRDFTAIVRQGEAVARPELAHAVHVEVEGLQPGRPYFYRFRCGGHASSVGRAKTAPARGEAVDRARFVVLGCQSFEQGFYTGHARAAEEDADFVYCYGDYIYEGAAAPTYTGSGGTMQNPRVHLGGECYSLDDYRRRYAQYKMDPDLHASHAAAAWFCTFDDHDVHSNWVGDVDEDGAPPEVFRLRRQAAFQAYYEHMPLRRSAFPAGSAMQIYRNAQWGDLMDLHLLDTRQHRSLQPCENARATTCAAVDAAEAQVLGEAQEAWLYRNLDASHAHWQVLAQQIMMMDLNRKEGPEVGYNLDTWAGYRIPRQRLLQRVRDRRIDNVVVLTGDEHQNYAGELHIDGREPDDAPVAAEFVVTSLSSSGDGQDQRADGRRFLADNAFLKFNNAQRGYAVCDVTPDVWRTGFKVLDKVLEPGGTLTTRATYAVERGSSRIGAA